MGRREERRTRGGDERMDDLEGDRKEEEDGWMTIAGKTCRE